MYSLLTTKPAETKTETDNAREMAESDSNRRQNNKEITVGESSE